MTISENISADYTLRPSELAATLALLVEARQPVILWGAPGSAKSAVAQQVAADANRQYVDVRALLLDPVDLRGIPWRDSADRTRWAPPAFLPPTDDPGRWLINLEELPSAVPMVQAALYQLVLDRKVGEYELPEGASLIACGNRESDRGVVHRMPTPLASRFVHLEIRVDAQDWCAWGAANGISPEVLFFVQLRPDLLHRFDPQLREAAFACLPDEIAVKGRGGTDFRPGFAWLEENGIRPGVCLYLTDMLCSSYPETEPSFDVVWANYAEPPGDWNREPWGERIQIEP